MSNEHRREQDSKLLTRTIMLGAMSGMRSMSAPALVSRRAVQHPLGFKHTVFAPLVSAQLSKLVGLAAIGEVVIDKVGILPNRIALLPLLGRAFLGGFAGAAVHAEAKQPVVQGIVVGAVAAVASSYLTYFLRRGVGKLLHLPDLPVALMEDAGVAALGRTAWKTYL